MRRLARSVSLFVAICVSAQPAWAEPANAWRISIDADRKVDTYLTLFMGDRPHEARWDEFLVRLFEFLDVDHDGRLRADEVRRAPSAASLAAFLRGDFFETSAKAERPSLDESRASWTPEQFVADYRKAGAIGIDLRTANSGDDTADTVDRLLFDVLAGGRDGGLTRDRLASAAAALHRFDTDDDERISRGELASEATPVVPSASKSAKRILPLSMGKPPQDAATLRIDLDSRRLDRSGAPPVPSRWLPSDTPAAVGLACESTWLRFASPRGEGDRSFESARRELLQTFETDDADNSAALDTGEIDASPSRETWQALLPLVDTDSNERLALGELARWLDALHVGAGRQVTITAADRGRQLFQRIDADHDGRLALRELSSAWERLAAWDADHDGRLTYGEIPAMVDIQVSLGQPRPADGELPTKPSPAQPAMTTPNWFSKMDRNGDGDLSPREFFGSQADFRRLDRNGNRLIDPQEAAP